MDFQSHTSHAPHCYSINPGALLHPNFTACPLLTPCALLLSHCTTPPSYMHYMPYDFPTALHTQGPSAVELPAQSTPTSSHANPPSLHPDFHLSLSSLASLLHHTSWASEATGSPNSAGCATLQHYTPGAMKGS